jgi:hypothetical protein
MPLVKGHILNSEAASESNKTVSFGARTILFLQALVRLIQFGGYVSFQNFDALCQRVRACPVRDDILSPVSVAAICHAIDLTAVLHLREIRCLQRSAAATCLLRDYGVPARMIIAARALPFRAHAWVEVDGAIVNDKVSTCSTYSLLESC